ncbi:EfeM/EfeO family lipoprotein [Actinoplanes sp. TBRC 11911]|uniref:imelysin family protein n=1 Tax=Actinoplanes sp. TBRC 11911 TaxID=2729386 RepID=UPI00145D1C86|nr:EfeM/EfeO family lipoprotein [Actinoplanes sp. TBRC 11911]NMO49816.1 EfeM/EfeO family lipoprotein [Actinoplanes sp. TBRC 11911]
MGWAKPTGGDQTIQVHNTDSVTMEVQLVDPASHGIYAEIESLAPGTIRPFHLVLGNGTYAFTCLPDGADVETGPSVTIKNGPATGAKAIAPVSETDLAPAVKTYRAHVSGGITTLAADVTTLRTALASGDRHRSEQAWLVAQMDYNRLGAAYDTFGDAADAIDGTPDGLPAGVRDKDWAGLRRIEFGLWHGESLPALGSLAAKLSGDVAGLRHDFGTERTDPNDLPLRSHEILENTLQFELSGAEDEGAHAELAVMSANLDGTRMVLDAIQPEIQPRFPAWPAVLDELSTLQKLVDAQHKAGTWKPVQSLSVYDREKLDGTLGQLLEDLAPIAAIGEVRRTQ